jgi:hypothetical protein
MGGNQAKMHTGKMGGAGGHPGQPHTMNQQMSHHQQQMGGQHHQQQMAGQHPQRKMGAQQHPQKQGGGNRPPPKGQPQGKKKPDKP